MNYLKFGIAIALGSYMLVVLLKLRRDLPGGLFPSSTTKTTTTITIFEHEDDV